MSLREYHLKILNDLKDLHDQRNFIEINPPNQLAIESALSTIKLLHLSNIDPFTIMLSAEGGIGFVFIYKQCYLSIEFLNTGEIVALKSFDKNNSPEIWDIDIKNIVNEINMLKHKKANDLDFHPKNLSLMIYLTPKPLEF